MEYLKVFETIDEQQSYLNGTIIKPSVTIARGDKSSIKYVPKVPKKVNHGILTITKRKAIITWEYPIASNFIIYYSTQMVNNNHQNAFQGQSTTGITLGPGETSVISINSIDPPEDDTYVYEIILEN